MNEAELIQRIRKGDQLAWETLISNYQQSVFRLAYLITGDPEDAEDIAQDTFIQFHRTLDRFDSARPVKPWLLRIAGNLARNRLRSFGRYLKAAKRWFAMTTPETQPSLESMATAQIESEALWQVIQGMSENDQAVIYLRYYLEMPVDETAAALDISPGTVKSRLHRALGRLREELKKRPELHKVLYESS